eukprot:7378537-Prymnesium_polylepis.1
MRRDLVDLGYSEADVDGMEPSRAAQIIARRTPSSRFPQQKAKSKRERFELQCVPLPRGRARPCLRRAQRRLRC